MTYEVKVYRIPVLDEELDAVLTMPSLQAYRDSPRWEPIVCADGVLYVWRSADTAEHPDAIEAILLTTRLLPRSCKWTLYTRTRSNKRPYVVLVNPRVVGGRLSNVFKEPAVVTEKTKNEFITEWLLTQTTILKELQLEDCTIDVDNVKCENEEYVVLYSVKLHFNELYFIPTTVRKEKQ